MVTRILRYSALLILPAGLLLADFSYEQTSKLTGGALLSMMKVAGAFSKQAREQTREPMHSTVAVKGNRMAHLSPTHVSVTDLDKETITNIDLEKKTYSVMTFAQLKAAMEQMAEKSKQKDPNQPEVNFKVSVNSTGQTKEINGVQTKEMIVKMIMESTDQKSGQKGGMTMTSDMWLAPKVAGYQEIADFYKRMAEKLGWMPSDNPFLNRPDFAKGMAQVYGEASKIDGMPVYQLIRMGAEAEGAPASGQSAQQPPQRQPQAEQPSSGGLGGVLAGRLGRFGRKPKQEENSAPPSAGGTQSSGNAPGALLEMTTEMSNFSAAPVDASKFEVPAGFKQVQPDTRRGGRQ